MFWGAFSHKGQANLIGILSNMNGQRYIQVLNDSFVPFIADVHPNNAICMQDCTAPHTANITMQNLADSNIDV